jgi:hypothetical protein
VSDDRRDHFETTRWSLVLAAGGSDSAAARQALATLCETYWRPIYLYTRKSGYSAEDAQDLTQAFLALLLKRMTSSTSDANEGGCARSCWPRCAISS